MAFFKIVPEILQNIRVVSNVSVHAIQPPDLLHHLLTNWLSLSAADLKMRYWNDTGNICTVYPIKFAHGVFFFFYICGYISQLSYHQRYIYDIEAESSAEQYMIYFISFLNVLFGYFNLEDKHLKSRKIYDLRICFWNIIRLKKIRQKAQAVFKPWLMSVYLIICFDCSMTFCWLLCHSVELSQESIAYGGYCINTLRPM